MTSKKGGSKCQRPPHIPPNKKNNEIEKKNN